MDGHAFVTLVGKLVTTVHVLAGYPIPDARIAVQVIPATVLNDMVCERFCNAQGAFLPGRGLFLADHLDPQNDVRHRAVLLHELVHEAQERSGAFADLPPCERHSRREAEAYAVEHAYLQRFGLSGVSLAGPQRWLGRPCNSEGSAFAQVRPASHGSAP